MSITHTQFPTVTHIPPCWDCLLLSYSAHYLSSFLVFSLEPKSLKNTSPPHQPSPTSVNFLHKPLENPPTLFRPSPTHLPPSLPFSSIQLHSSSLSSAAVFPDSSQHTHPEIDPPMHFHAAIMATS